MSHIKTLIVAALFLLSGIAAYAQSTAQNTAAILQTWQTNCGDPNPELAIGYLRDAMKTNDPIIDRICLRQGLNSDNGDVRSAALRAAIASGSMLLFQVTEPKGDSLPYNDKNLWSYMQTGLFIHVTGGNVQTGTATWQPMVGLAQPSQQYQGTVNVIGSIVRWGGRIFNSSICQLTAKLGQGDVLQGTFQCNGGALFPVTTHLLN